MLNILFLQADRQYNQVLRASLLHKLSTWNIYFATDAESAWKCLGSTPVDVILAELTPENEALVVAKVRENYPEIIRIALVAESHSHKSSHSNFHQFLVLPFAVRELEVAVERSCRLRDLLRGEAMSKIVSGLGELPSAPTVYLKLIKRLERPDASVAEIAEILGGDVAISAKLLQLVNSALFRTSHEIATVDLAASYLGLAVIKNLVLSAEVFCFFERKTEMVGFSIEDLQTHSQLTAKIAAELNLTKEDQEAAVVAGLLHDIGKLVLAWKMPERFLRITAKAREQNRPLYQLEEELWGITHAEVGAYLLGLWGLPLAISEAVAYHHSPSKVPHSQFGALVAVYIANLLAHEQAGTVVEASPEWDLDLLEQMGVANRLPVWRELASGIRV